MSLYLTPGSQPVVLLGMLSVFLCYLKNAIVHSLTEWLLTWELFLFSGYYVFFFSREFSCRNELKNRFDCIAVDYLVYTFEVVNNIRQSYPLPILLGALLLLTFFVTGLFHRSGVFATSFNSHS